MRKLVLILTVMAFAVVAIAAFVSAEEATHAYVGAKKCKTCHKAQFASWSETGHATAFDVLSDEEKTKEECVGCHITGKLADETVLEGVQCEACHGPGKDYKSPKIMSKKKWAADPDAHKKMAIEAGLVYPIEENCVKCHTKEGNANFKEFNFEEAKGKVHPVMAEEGK
ncbi:MAG: multiheme c-type cytochrome [bacterium]|nr:multiheme c-type cytochrome [bacterium]